MKFTFMLFKSWLNSSSCANWGIVLLENCIVVRWHRLDHETYLITQIVNVLPCSNSAMKGNNGINKIPRYSCPNHQRTSPVFYFWNCEVRIVSFLGCSPNVNSSWCREQCEGRLIWPYHARFSSCLMSKFYGSDTIVYESELYFQ
jgi:hypothetical protein